MKRIINKNKKYRTISLFSGIGGLDLGFDYAGFNVIWANDYDKYAVQTYRENISKNIVCADIRNEMENIPSHDILIAGFPCQPFSTLGSLKGFDDERGTLFFTIKEILKRNKTKVAVLENVKNIMNHNKGETFKRLLRELTELGYEVNFNVLDTQDFGLPQRRRRVFIVAFLKEFFLSAEFNFPTPLKLNYKTQDILDEIVDNKYFISKKMINTILSKGTKGYIVKPTIDQEISKTLTATMHKMHRASQDNYFTDNKNYLRFKDKNKTNIRKLTPNECRKLQGFPNDWKQVVSDTQAYKQFGNAVTVDVAYHLAKQIINYISINKCNNW
ncbi:DNA cytosine methyltransferase [Candidatus Izemoplasma sp. B36]|uniref:DNA cytosine methyltransferase n=1 Tax=Candidatus Izemoplasma sp. B36 TaxID=3242468 RepID=UPI003557A3AE